MAAAQVGSSSSSLSRFSLLEEEVDEEEDGRAGATGRLAGGVFVTGAVEVDGEGSKPNNRVLV